MGPMGILTYYGVLVTPMAGPNLAMAPLAEDMTALAVDVVGVAVDTV